MLKTQALHGVVQLNIDAQIVGIEFELIAGADGGLLIDSKPQPRNMAIDLDLPVMVVRRLGAKINDAKRRRYMIGTAHQAEASWGLCRARTGAKASRCCKVVGTSAVAVSMVASARP